MIVWLLLAFVFFIFVALKTPRHGILFYIPFVCVTFFVFDRLFSAKVKNIIVVLLPLLVIGETLAYHPVPYVGGYREAAEFVSTRLSKNGRVGFLGNRDGSFIFNIRQIDPDRNITVTRIDKLLLDVNVMPQLGLNAKNISSKEMLRMMRDYALEYVVVADGQWLEEPVIRRFDAMLKGAKFRLEKTTAYRAIKTSCTCSIFLYTTSCIASSYGERA